MPMHQVRSTSWKISPISALLGFPVKLSPGFETQSTPPNRKQLFNGMAGAFHVEVDMTSPKFGEAQGTRAELEGPVAFMRCDGKDLDPLQLDTLFMYILLSVGVGFFPEFPHLPKAMTDAVKVEIAKKLTPSAFAAYYEKDRQQQIAAGKKKWETLECPVQLDGGVEAVFCAACGSQSMDGKELQPCKRCNRGRARYCGESCQLADRKQHKNSCKKALAAQAKAAARKSSEDS